MEIDWKLIIPVGVNLIAFAFGYGMLWQKVNGVKESVDGLKRIVTNGLSDKVTKIHTRVEVLAARMGFEEGE